LKKGLLKHQKTHKREKTRHSSIRRSWDLLIEGEGELVDREGELIDREGELGEVSVEGAHGGVWT